ncbi:small subunit ribosomal protein, cytoplasmic [Pelomyxa schiedti]|nr:small subunit ribosomal protein, cytoplasmic [Pelomyxa schiedti]
MFSAAKKIIKKDKTAPISPVEHTVAQALLDLELGGPVDMREEIKNLYCLSAKMVAVDKKRRAIVVFIPYRFLRQYHRIQARLIPELEKKLNGKHVIIVAQRSIIFKAKRGEKGYGKPRPHCHTMTAVHEAILNDIVFPTEIVGKRTRFRVDGSKLTTVHLDPRDPHHVKEKIKTFTTVYRKLTGRSIHFTFPIEEP